MILLCGIPSAQPLRMVLDEARMMAVPHLLYNQRGFACTELEFEVNAGSVAAPDREKLVSELGDLEEMRRMV